MGEALKFVDESTGLSPSPQRIEHSQEAWHWSSRWNFYEWPEKEGAVWCWSESLEEARRLATGFSLPHSLSAEAYAAIFTPQGAAGLARKAEGLARFSDTLEQMKILSADAAGVPSCRIEDWPDLEIRGAHLDLKYYMHSLGYLSGWLDTLRDCKINTLLLEYEDKFPFQTHAEVTSDHAMEREELAAFLEKARRLGLRVIPMFPTLGHLEFVLRHEKFAHLRGGANGEYFTEVRVGDREALELVFSFLDEVLEFHGPDEWFHLGGDEPWFLKKRMSEDPSGTVGDYIAHMDEVCRYVIDRGKRPLIYDDFLRSLEPDVRRSSLARLPCEVILCVWDYGANLRWPAANLLEAVEEYRAAGNDFLGLPCFNWGLGVPFFRDYTIPNTLAMINLAQSRGGLGVIHTGWACFRVPLPLANMGLAIAGARSWNFSPNSNSRSTENAFCRLAFGPGTRAVADVLLNLARQIEVPTTSGRPLSLPHFYYMDSVLQFGSHAERMRLGASLDLYGNADYKGIVEKKIELILDSPHFGGITQALRSHRDEAQELVTVLSGASGLVRRGREAFDLLMWMANFKVHCCERMLALLENDCTEAACALAVGRELLGQMEVIFGFFLHADEMSAEAETLFGGELSLLEELASPPVTKRRALLVPSA